ncbi:MAG: hypothetical protein ACJA14_001746, partial [Ilumatobacter sp.]
MYDATCSSRAAGPAAPRDVRIFTPT